VFYTEVIKFEQAIYVTCVTMKVLMKPRSLVGLCLSGRPKCKHYWTFWVDRTRGASSLPA